MKRIALLSFIACMMCALSYAQTADTAKKKAPAPYLQYPGMPAFNILLSDSTTVLNTFNIPKGRPVMLVFFDPDCKHCKAETKELMAGIDSLSNIDIYFVSPNHSMTSIRQFYDDNHMAGHANIKGIGRDYEFFFATYYDVNFIPDIALYDDHKKFLRLFEGHAKVSELWAYTHK